MADVKDYQYGDDGDLVIVNGDFVLIESAQQHQQDLIMLSPGGNSQFPQSGVDIKTFIEDDADKSKLKQKINDEFEADGMIIDSLLIDDNYQATIQASY